MKLDVKELAVTVREQDMNGTLAVLRNDFWKFASWGAQAFKNFNNKVMRFKVNGNHHKGHVYVVVNGSDLYDVYLTTTHGNIVKEMIDIYFDELADRIDDSIERIDEYVK